jgi:histidyl-tRNA synthetase
MTMHERHSRKDSKKIEYSFDILGTLKSIADATLIQIAYQSALERDIEEISLEINSLGDRDSLNRFTREVTAYFRKHIADLHPDCRQAFKKNPFAGLQCNHEKCLPIQEHAPHSINYLSEPSRAYFMELLEILETTGIPYSINDGLIENPDYASHLVFKLFGKEQGKDRELIAYGARWGNIAKKIGLKKDIPCSSLTLCVPKSAKAEAKVKKIKKPQLYFIQMGHEAKLKSLNLLEILRKAKIPIYHSLTKDKLTAQMLSAENLRVPYILIMGQKESMDNTVLVREMVNRSQDTVRIDHVADHLKKILP